ncbi:hypothetical protein C8R45DRAFT_1212894 [Mycena sanguinolenta]|nr:hypothetical protein C8R45DRAFT_1212894 [Mycena sanguinolenta]
MPGIILSCGAEDPLGDVLQDEKPFQPQILPIPLDSASPAAEKRKRSNGCGTRVHYVAMMSSTNMWRAAELYDENGLIVPLEERYFSDADAELLSLGWKPCGCVRSGVGCAVCGNPLGALFTPCLPHKESRTGTNYYTILPTAVSPPVPPYVSEPRPRAQGPWPFPVSPRSVRALLASGRVSVPVTVLEPASESASRSAPTRHRHPTSPPPPARIRGLHADAVTGGCPRRFAARLGRRRRKRVTNCQYRHKQRGRGWGPGVWEMITTRHAADRNTSPRKPYDIEAT